MKYSSSYSATFANLQWIEAGIPPGGRHARKRNEAEAAKDPQLDQKTAVAEFILSDLSAKAGMAMPVFSVTEKVSSANAGAYPQPSGNIRMSKLYASYHSERGLRGVLAHELAHIKLAHAASGSLAVMAALMFVGIGITESVRFVRANAAQNPALAAAAVGLAFTLPAIAHLAFVMLRRAHERAADDYGATLCGDAETMIDNLLASASFTGEGKEVWRQRTSWLDVWETHPNDNERLTLLIARSMKDKID